MLTVMKDGIPFSFSINETLKDVENFRKWLETIGFFKTFKVGDIVKVTDCGKRYTTYHEWFEENGVSIDIAARYAFQDNKGIPQCYDYKVVAVGPHRDNANVQLCAIESSDAIFPSIVYLIEASGLKRCDEYSFEKKV